MSSRGVGGQLPLPHHQQGHQWRGTEPTCRGDGSGHLCRVPCWGPSVPRAPAVLPRPPCALCLRAPRCTPGHSSCTRGPGDSGGGCARLSAPPWSPSHPSRTVRSTRRGAWGPWLPRHLLETHVSLWVWRVRRCSRESPHVTAATTAKALRPLSRGPCPDPGREGLRDPRPVLGRRMPSPRPLRAPRGVSALRPCPFTPCVTLHALHGGQECVGAGTGGQDACSHSGRSAPSGAGVGPADRAACAGCTPWGRRGS